MVVRITCVMMAAFAALVVAACPQGIIAQTPEPLATPTPTPEAGLPGLRLEHQCAPATMRPGEWTAVECVTLYINESDQALPPGRVEIVPATSGPVVETFFVEVRRDGELLPVGTTPTSFEGEGIAPGETVESRTTLLMNMSMEGESRSELRVVSLDGQVAASTPLVFVGDAEAADPPKELSTGRRFTVVQEADGAYRALYEATVTNTSTEEVSGLVLTARYDGPAALVEASPAPRSESAAANVASWDLSSFGKSSLAPGESLTLQAAYGFSSGPGCGSMTAAAAVKATMGGVERSYAAAPMSSGWFGVCPTPEPPPTPQPVDGGQGEGGSEETIHPPVLLPSTGLAPVEDNGVSETGAASLAAAGALLLAAGAAGYLRARWWKMLAAGLRIAR